MSVRKTKRKTTKRHSKKTTKRRAKVKIQMLEINYRRVLMYSDVVRLLLPDGYKMRPLPTRLEDKVVEFNHDDRHWVATVVPKQKKWFGRGYWVDKDEMREFCQNPSGFCTDYFGETSKPGWSAKQFVNESDFEGNSALLLLQFQELQT